MNDKLDSQTLRRLKETAAKVHSASIAHNQLGQACFTSLLNLCQVIVDWKNDFQALPFRERPQKSWNAHVRKEAPGMGLKFKTGRQADNYVALAGEASKLSSQELSECLDGCHTAQEARRRLKNRKRGPGATKPAPVRDFQKLSSKGHNQSIKLVEAAPEHLKAYTERIQHMLNFVSIEAKRAADAPMPLKDLRAPAWLKHQITAQYAMNGFRGVDESVQRFLTEVQLHEEKTPGSTPMDFDIAGFAGTVRDLLEKEYGKERMISPDKWRANYPTPPLKRRPYRDPITGTEPAVVENDEEKQVELVLN